MTEKVRNILRFCFEVFIKKKTQDSLFIAEFIYPIWWSEHREGFRGFIYLTLINYSPENIHLKSFKWKSSSDEFSFIGKCFFELIEQNFGRIERAALSITVTWWKQNHSRWEEKWWEIRFRQSLMSRATIYSWKHLLDH